MGDGGIKLKQTFSRFCSANTQVAPEVILRNALDLYGEIFKEVSHTLQYGLQDDDTGHLYPSCKIISLDSDVTESKVTPQISISFTVEFEEIN